MTELAAKIAKSDVSYHGRHEETRQEMLRMISQVNRTDQIVSQIEELIGAPERSGTNI